MKKVFYFALGYAAILASVNYNVSSSKSASESRNYETVYNSSSKVTETEDCDLYINNTFYTVVHPYWYNSISCNFSTRQSNVSEMF